MASSPNAIRSSSANRPASKKPRRKKSKSTPTSRYLTARTAQDNTQPHDDVEIEYVPDTDLVLTSLSSTCPSMTETQVLDYFASVFHKFNVEQSSDSDPEDNANDSAAANLDQHTHSDSDSDASVDGQLSGRKLRKAARLTVAELKQLVDKPEVVDWVDVTAPDPKLLVDIKSTRNTIGIPVHWSQKRKYLQNKRGLVKDPFKLPDFILATGILEMRQAIESKDDKLKAKMRERVQPKLGKLVIDYSKLHAAFFKWQTKPPLSQFGEVYYEGKEFETKLKHIRPGAGLSTELRNALGMPTNSPPPYLIHMQRHGPPPSYPGLKIPGLNAPIPPGASWGFHPGGWGKPPVDEYGRPIYGDVYGTMYDPMSVYREANPMASGPLWGEIEVNEYATLQDDGEDEIDDDDEIGSDDDQDEGLGPTDQGTLGVQEISSFGSDGADALKSVRGLEAVAEEEDMEMEMDMEEFAAGLVTPAPGIAAQLGANSSGLETETPRPPQELYKIVNQTSSAATTGTLMGSDHVYEIRKRPVPGTETETPMPGVGSNADEHARKKRRADVPAAASANASGSSGRPRREFKF